jgi:hypothetical protein
MMQFVLYFPHCLYYSTLDTIQVFKSINRGKFHKMRWCDYGLMANAHALIMRTQQTGVNGLMARSEFKVLCGQEFKLTTPNDQLRQNLSVGIFTEVLTSHSTCVL